MFSTIPRAVITPLVCLLEILAAYERFWMGVTPVTERLGPQYVAIHAAKMALFDAVTHDLNGVVDPNGDVFVDVVARLRLALNHGSDLRTRLDAALRAVASPPPAEGQAAARRWDVVHERDGSEVATALEELVTAVG